MAEQKNAREEKILNFWEEGGFFNKSVNEKIHTEKDYIFYDGPPFANGLPHYGHLLTGFVKDVFARYHTSLGSRVERKFGWDCHGLPAEMESEKELKVSGRLAIKEFNGKFDDQDIVDENGEKLYGIAAFNEHCRSSVMKYTNEWENYVTRQGRWVDFKNSYKTMDLPYMQSVIAAFGKLFEQGLIYESTRVMPYSWKCETPLSNFETKMDNSYREKESKTATVKFKITENGKEKLKISQKDAYFLAWTTTPWTLPSNLALAVGSEIEYGIFAKENEVFIIAKSLAKKYEKEMSGFELIKTVSGFDLENIEYTPLFPYFKDTKNAFRVLIGDFVSTEDGTGIVHMAPGFGEDDFKLCRANNIETLCPIDDGGKFFDKKIVDLEYNLAGKDDKISLFGRCVLEESTNDKGKKNYDGVNEDVIKYLKSQNLWLKTEQYLHNYPHCWRTDTPLIYKAVSSWYVNVAGDGQGEVKIETGSGKKTIKERMIELNKDINWIPDHIRDGQFGKWLEGSRDWSISRNRFFGCPIPVWKKDDEVFVFDTIEKMESFFRDDYISDFKQGKNSGKYIQKDGSFKITDLHRPYVDELIKHEKNGDIERIEDVFDCWFESGSMPFASVGFKFDDAKPHNFPADFIVEYVAQTRGWFYTLMILGTALFDSAPFKNCICHGVILDANGDKLSKRLRNYPDPMLMFDKYGSDAMRWFLLSSPVMRGGELYMDQTGDQIRDASRMVVVPFLNALNFFTTYSKIDNIKCKNIINSTEIKSEMNQYAISLTIDAIEKIKISMDEYNTPLACSAFEKFLDGLNNWYIRRNKDVFWENGITDVKQEAFDTLYSVLLNISYSISPILPFTTEIVFGELNK